MKKNLLRCPNCLKQILGEMLPDGIFRIMRFHNGYTDVVGSDFGVICGNCNETVFIRKGVDYGSSSFGYGFTGEKMLIYAYESTYSQTNGSLGIGSN